MNKKYLLITATTRAMLETFRYWILSFLTEGVGIKTLCFKDTENILPEKRRFDLSIALVFEEQEIEEAQIFLGGLRTQGIDLGSTMVVFSPSVPEGLLGPPIDTFTFRLPLAHCMPHILNKLQTSSSLYVQDAGECFKAFTRREKEVLELLAQGIGIKEVAHILGISKYTVITYQRNLYLKTGARTLQQLALFAALHVRASS